MNEQVLWGLVIPVAAIAVIFIIAEIVNQVLDLLDR